MDPRGAGSGSPFVSNAQPIDLLATADEASVDRLVERVSRTFERKLRIERERRGF